MYVVDATRCRGNDHLKRCFVNILNGGGEGIMVNKPNSLYIKARVDSLKSEGDSLPEFVLTYTLQATFFKSY